MQDKQLAELSAVVIECCVYLRPLPGGEENNVRTILASGFSPNVVDYDRRTGLMLACGAGHEGVVRALLEAGADPQLVDAFGGTAMLECVKVSGARSTLQIPASCTSDTLKERRLEAKSASDPILLSKSECHCLSYMADLKPGVIKL